MRLWPFIQMVPLLALLLPGGASGAAAGKGGALSTNELAFLAGDANGVPGDQVLVPVRVNNFAGISSFQFSFHWNPLLAVFVGVENFGLAGLAEGNFGATLASSGTLTVSWDNLVSQSVDDGTSLFQVRLQLIGVPGSSSSLDLDGNPTLLEAGDAASQSVPVAVLSGQLTINQLNAAPTLALIGDKNVDEGSLLTFVVSATDADVPAQTLTYSLDAGAPAGANIDPATGVFSWMPTEVQGPGPASVTIRVTDNGVPARSAAQAITITVNEVNQAPSLAPIGDKTVQAGDLLHFSAVASDPDLPAQTLTFSLDPGAPAGAGIDPATGLFSWQTPQSALTTTNPVTIRVTDSGSPARSASATFHIVVLANVRLTLSISPATSGGITLSWPTEPGKTYKLQYKEEVTAPTWTDLSGPVLADGVSLRWIDEPKGTARRFYRVVEVSGAPLLLSITPGAKNVVILSWPTQPDLTYEVQYKDETSVGPWTSLSGPLSAGGSSLSFEDEPKAAARRFYRVLEY
jgi:hypothetical protein